MARIRSIHPGLFSDPEFASLSDAAQIFYLGLLTEADDNGIFEWNAAKLRIRIRPGKDGSTEPLLSELQDADKVRPYEVDGRKYGALRNFRRFQRPKFPKSWHPITADVRSYVGLTAYTSPESGNGGPSSPSIPEISPQREEGGGKRNDGRGKNITTTPSVANSAQAREPASRSQLVGNWAPSEAEVEAMRKELPWLVGELYERRMADFRDWCEANATRTFSPAATWRGFMRKTKQQDIPGETFDQRRIRLAMEAVRAAS